MRALLGLLAVAALAGCSSGGISEADNAKLKEDFSKEKYEEAMRKAGRGAELEAEKAAAEKRGG